MDCRKPLRRSLILLVIVALAAAGIVTKGQAAEVQGQRPMMIVGDTFQFTPGAWASYLVHDRAKKEYYRLYMATLEKRQKDGKSCSWMEVGITPEKDPAVVTRFLVEETPKGPGELMDVIVQVQGYAPFTVPESFYKGAGEDRDVGRFAGASVAKRIARRVIPLDGRNIQAWDVEALDAKGEPMEALVSEDVAPIGVIMAESAALGMYLSDWGAGAKSKIEGKPVNFYWWLMMQMGGALSK